MNDLFENKIPNSIIWSTESINIINKIMKYINSIKLMKPIGYIVKYYINKYRPNEVETKISTIDNIKINRDGLILAYVCEIYLERKKPDSKIILSKSLIYKAFGGIISDVIKDIFYYKSWSLNFSEIYMVNALAEILAGYSDDNNRDIIKSTFFVTKKLMEIDNIIYNIDSLLLHTEDINLDILSGKLRREIMDIMKTKRTMYLRIFLIISNHMIKENSLISSSWAKNKIRIKNMESLKEILTNEIIEIIICITGYIINLN